MACKAPETCARCLWCWPCLTGADGEQRVCYHTKSAHYHRQRHKEDKACADFEYGIAASGYPKGRERIRK